MLLRWRALRRCAAGASLFCHSVHFAERKMRSLLPNPWARVAVGGAAVVLLTLAVGSQTYNGAGMRTISAAIEGGAAPGVRLSAEDSLHGHHPGRGVQGRRGGPLLLCRGDVRVRRGPALGIPAGFAAAIGLAAVFCGATNCPVASIFLSIEMFGGEGLLYFALACGLSYIFSGYSGLYSSQTILYSKLKARYINIHTNSSPSSAHEPGER